MFTYLKRNWGNSVFVPLLSLLVGIAFHVPYWENLYAAALMWITTIALFMCDNVISRLERPLHTFPLYTEDELKEFDYAVYVWQNKILEQMNSTH